MSEQALGTSDGGARKPRKHVPSTSPRVDPDVIAAAAGRFVAKASDATPKHQRQDRPPPARGPPPDLAGLSKLERLRIAPMPEASRLSSLSEDSLRRNHRDKIIKLSPRREGMRVEDALMLRKPTHAV